MGWMMDGSVDLFQVLQLDGLELCKFIYLCKLTSERVSIHVFQCSFESL